MAMAKVVGSPFGPDETPILGDSVQIHPSGFVAIVVVPYNPRTASQQRQRLRVAVMNESLRFIGSGWRGFWIEFVSTGSQHLWHQLLVQVGARATGFVANRYNVMVAAIGVAGLVSWDAETAAVGLAAVSVPEGEIRSSGLVLLRLIAAIYESSVDFEPGLSEPDAENAADWVAAYLA